MIAVVLAAVMTIAVAPTVRAQTQTPAACLDFATQADAQAFYESEGGPANDPHGLDPDRDGRACSAESAPTSATPTASVPQGVTATASANDDLPPGSGGRSPFAWLGIALAIGGIGVTAYSLLRRRRPPPPPLPPRLDLDDVGW